MTTLPNDDDHLDALNDIVLEYTETQSDDAWHEVKVYCNENDLDPDGFQITWEGESWVVDIASL